MNRCGVNGVPSWTQCFGFRGGMENVHFAIKSGSMNRSHFLTCSGPDDSFLSSKMSFYMLSAEISSGSVSAGCGWRPEVLSSWHNRLWKYEFRAAEYFYCHRWLSLFVASNEILLSLSQMFEEGFTKLPFSSSLLTLSVLCISFLTVWRFCYLFSPACTVQGKMGQECSYTLYLL